MKWKKSAVFSSSLLLGLGISGILLWLLAGPATAYADPINFFVSASGGGSACTQAAPCDLQTAMGQAVDGNSIYLGAGTYTSSGPSVITITENITVFGGWDGTTTSPPVRDPASYPTTLDGEHERQVVYIGNWLTPTLDGLIITGGDATAAWDPGRGGGIYSINSSPIIENNIIRNNVASTNGRGTGGGVYIHSGANARIVNNIILSNTASITGGTADGGGVALVWHPGALVPGNQVAHNVAQGGTAEYFGSDGGGMTFETSEVEPVTGTLIHNSFVANDWGSGNGRIAIHMTEMKITLVLTNNLIYSHTYGVYANVVSTATLYNTLFFANSAGDLGPFGNYTNIDPITDQAPLLNTDFHLLPGSPAIDAGAVVPWLTTDIDGDPRPFHLGYDIGADEVTIIPEYFTYLPLINR